VHHGWSRTWLNGFFSTVRRRFEFWLGRQTDLASGVVFTAQNRSRASPVDQGCLVATSSDCPNEVGARFRLRQYGSGYGRAPDASGALRPTVVPGHVGVVAALERVWFVMTTDPLPMGFSRPVAGSETHCNRLKDVPIRQRDFAIVRKSAAWLRPVTIRWPNCRNITFGSSPGESVMKKVVCPRRRPRVMRFRISSGAGFALRLSAP
jgi:hypothetical protein